MKKIIVLLALLVVVVLFFVCDLGQYLTLDYVKAQQQALNQYYAENRLFALLGFFLLYVVITGASLPGAAVLTLAGGAIFSDRFVLPQHRSAFFLMAAVAVVV